MSVSALRFSRYYNEHHFLIYCFFIALRILYRKKLIEKKNVICFFFFSHTDKNNQRPPRKAYGRLSVDSDENCNRTTNTSSRQKYNNPFDELDNFDILDDSAKYTGNENTSSASHEPNDNDSDIELDSASSKSNSNERNNESTINRLQAMVISDDDDYGKLKFGFFSLALFCSWLLHISHSKGCTERCEFIVPTKE